MSRVIEKFGDMRILEPIATLYAPNYQNKETENNVFSENERNLNRAQLYFKYKFNAYKEDELSQEEKETIANFYQEEALSDIAAKCDDSLQVDQLLNLKSLATVQNPAIEQLFRVIPTLMSDVKFMSAINIEPVSNKFGDLCWIIPRLQKCIPEVTAKYYANIMKTFMGVDGQDFDLLNGFSTHVSALVLNMYPLKKWLMDKVATGELADPCEEDEDKLETLYGEEHTEFVIEETKRLLNELFVEQRDQTIVAPIGFNTVLNKLAGAFPQHAEKILSLNIEDVFIKRTILDIIDTDAEKKAENIKLFKEATDDFVRLNQSGFYEQDGCKIPLFRDVDKSHLIYQSLLYASDSLNYNDSVDAPDKARELILEYMHEWLETNLDGKIMMNDNAVEKLLSILATSVKPFIGENPMMYYNDNTYLRALTNVSQILENVNMGLTRDYGSAKAHEELPKEDDFIPGEEQ